MKSAVLVWYYLALVVIIAAPLLAGYFFFPALVNFYLVIVLLGLLAALNPFIFLWLSEKRRSEILQRQLTEPQTPGEAETGRRLIKELNQDLESRTRSLEAKDLELRLANQRLQKLDQAKFEFVSVTTHQLRTPLAAIKWTFHMLMTGELGPVTPEQKLFLQKGYESAERAITIVNELLNIDYIEANREASRLNYEFRPTDAVELAENVVFGFTNQTKEKNIILSVRKPSRPLPPIELDPRKIHIVLENLIDNALKYTPAGGQVTVTIKDDKLNSAQSVLELEVADSGIGIPTAEQGKVFQRFFRCTNAIKVVTDGNGLGLAIAKDIVENHGGQIWFESREGSGTTFRFTLPRLQSKSKV